MMRPHNLDYILKDKVARRSWAPVSFRNKNVRVNKSRTLGSRLVCRANENQNIKRKALHNIVSCCVLQKQSEHIIKSQATKEVATERQRHLNSSYWTTTIIMTFGAAFACAYRRDLPRQARKAAGKQQQSSSTTPVWQPPTPRPFSTVPAKQPALTREQKEDDLWRADVSAAIFSSFHEYPYCQCEQDDV